MSAAHLLEELTREGFILTAASNDLDVDAPAGRITPTILARLRLHKAELRGLLGLLGARAMGVTLDMKGEIEQRMADSGSIRVASADH